MSTSMYPCPVLCGVVGMGLFFFFQAEDGIRDLTVTGVQTCALPIYSVTDERTKPHTVYSVTLTRPVDLFFLARRFKLLPLVDAEYGSAAFVAGTRPAEYEVRVSTTGLLMRPVIH